MATEGSGSKTYMLPEGTLLKERYRILAVIGEGGFGITYAGRDEVLDTEVAVKEYYPADIATRTITVSSTVSTWSEADADRYEKGREGFLKEARTLAKFKNDPGIVSVYDFFSENNTAYIVMEYLPGENLRKTLTKKGTMSFDESYCLLLPVMASLEKIHAEGLIHRDVSPDNIQMGLDGRPKLMDFGAARAIPKDGEKTLSLLLKPGYSPEEQYIGSEKQGPWTDVYSLCATLYRMITGMRPEDSLQRMLLDELKKPSELGIDINPQAEAVLMKGLAIRPADRYRSVEALKRAFEEAKAGIPAAGDVPGAETDVEAGGKKTDVEAEGVKDGKAGSRKGILAGIIAAVAVIALIAGLTLTKKPSPEDGTGPVPQAAESSASGSTAEESAEAAGTAAESAEPGSTAEESRAEEAPAKDPVLSQTGEALFYGRRQAAGSLSVFIKNSGLQQLNVDGDTLYTVTDLPYTYFGFPLETGEQGILLIYPDETEHLYALIGKYVIEGGNLKILPEKEDPKGLLAVLEAAAFEAGGLSPADILPADIDEQFLYAEEPLVYRVTVKRGSLFLSPDPEAEGSRYVTEETALSGAAGRYGEPAEDLSASDISGICIGTLAEGSSCEIYFGDGGEAEDAVLKSLYPSIKCISLEWNGVRRQYNGREEVFEEPGRISNTDYFNTAPFGFILVRNTDEEPAAAFFQNPLDDK